MHILAHYTLTPDEALRGTRVFKRVWYAASVGSGLVLIGLGLAGAVLSRGGTSFSLFMVLNGLLFAVLPEAVLRTARRRRNAQTLSPLAVRFDDEGLTLTTESSEGHVPWASFETIHRRSGFWIFRINRAQAVLVPERVLDEATSAELEAFLLARNLLRR